MEEKKIALTDEQRNILDIASGGSPLVVEAYAGTGKTSTMKAVAARCRSEGKTGLYFVYNAEMKKEAVERKFPIDCKTVHGMGYSYTVGEGKMFSKDRIAQGSVPGFLVAEAIPIPESPFLGRMVSASRMASLALSTIKKFCYSADDTLDIGHVCLDDYAKLVRAVIHEQRALMEEAIRLKNLKIVPKYESTIRECFHEEKELKKRVLEASFIVWGEMLKPQGKVPILHDVYLKKFVQGVSAGEYKLPKLDFVILDEAQDSNQITLKLMEEFLKNGTQPIAVGDTFQQIYAWRGAENSLAQIEKWAGAKKAILSRSWRFGETIADLTNRYMREYMDPSFSIKGNPAIKSSVGPVPMADGIVCRTNSGVLQALFSELQNGRVPYIPKGREISKAIDDIQLLRDGRKPKTPEFQIFRNHDEFSEFCQTEEGKQLDMLSKMIDSYGAESLSEQLHLSGKNTEKSDVVIKTIHGWKGDEAASIKIHSDLPTGPQFTRSQEEGRLGYVAITRAMRVIDPSAWKILADLSPREGPATEFPSSGKTGEHTKKNHLIGKFSPKTLAL